MNRYFDYRIQLDEKRPEHKPNYGLVIFIPPIEFNADEFESYVTQIPWKKRSIDKLYLLISSINFTEVKKASASPIGIRTMSVMDSPLIFT